MSGKKSATGKKSSRKTPGRSPLKKPGSQRNQDSQLQSGSDRDGEDSREEPGFPIIGIGASAGGLEALEAFLRNLPPDTGMGFVVVTHQHAGHVSLLPEILAKATAMPVAPAAEGIFVEANHLYIGPPGTELTIHHGRLHCAKGSGGATLHLPIDQFLRSLAEDQGKRAICIILSGTGTDGTLGLKEIKAASGMAMVEDPQSARYSGMPSSAIATGLVDYVLPPDKMPNQLLAYGQGPFLTSTEAPPVPPEPMKEIFQVLRSRTGNDFSSYKASTVRRRIERRMNVHQIEKPSEYVRFLRENPGESDLLFKELLISVTSFFRDEEAYEALAGGPLPERLQSLAEGETFRAWVPGCATGEEVYSLAILVRECMDKLGRQFEVQLFGTDLDEAAIGTARSGRYPDGIAADVSGERLKRWFSHDDSFYRVRKDLREMAVFAPQNIIHDPPFTRLDFLSCRNLMIYLDAGLQKRLIPLFHYALKPGGILFLGPSETVGGFTDLFEVIDKKWKIYRRRKTNAAAHRLPDIPSRIAAKTVGAGVQFESDLVTVTAERQASSAIHRLLLERYCPASVVVNDRGDIIHVNGRTGAYLEPVPGQPRMNVLEMAREGLKVDLGSALRQAAAENREIVRPNLRVRTNGDFTLVELSVVKILEPEALRGLFLIAFRPAPPAKELFPEPSEETGDATQGPPSQIAELERELQHTRESHQATIEELETSNEELKSANEELQSTNEELQSSNEELETAREEMQSLNEELTTVNTEMESKIEALAQANDDLENLLNSTEIATLFLDNELSIKRYTQRARGIFSLIPTDVGRPIGDLASGLDYDRLVTDCQEVIETLESRESEVASRDGAWYLMRIMPYRTAENLIDGVVLTFVNIDQVKKNREERAFFEAIVETVRAPLVVLDHDLRVVSCNRAFYETFQTRARPTVGESIFEIGGDIWEIPELRSRLEQLLATEEGFENFRVEAVFPRIGRRIFQLNARMIALDPGIPPLVLLAMEEVE